MKKYRVIDLFSGCGGISVGFDMTNKCELVGAIDFAQAACDTYKKNFPNANVICCDITKKTVEETGFKDIDIIIGGPPCQGFSALNRHEKNREEDPRNVLFMQYIRFVKELKPKALMIENVRQILTQKNGYAKNAICEMLDEIGYNVSYKVIKASDFGVPQKRVRAVFVGIRKDLGSFDFNDLEKRRVEKNVTVGEALADLFELEQMNSQESIHNIDGNIRNSYLDIMHDGTNKIHNHFMRYPNEIVQQRIQHVAEGHNWKDVPEELFPSHRDNRHSNYCRRLNRNDVSITIDTGHDVYFHPLFNRVPTVRESARIQSFPDRFIFVGTKNDQLKQVGNAVPPLMAKAIAETMMEVLNEKK